MVSSEHVSGCKTKIMPFYSFCLACHTEPVMNFYPIIIWVVFVVKWLGKGSGIVFRVFLEASFASS